MGKIADSVNSLKSEVYCCCMFHVPLEVDCFDDSNVNRMFGISCYQGQACVS